MQTFKKRKAALAVAAGVLVGGILAACDTGSLPTTTGVGAENPSAVQPTGTIQGNLTDSTTGEPIVGATIDIGVAKATTNSAGVFLISNVPATRSVGINSFGTNVTGTYEGVIDLRTVTSPVNMTSASTTVRYPDTTTVSWTVNFTSLEDASLDGAGGGETVSSNHDTPVTGLVAGVTPAVGKLSTSLSGEIRVKSTNALVGEAYTVQLWQGGTLAQQMVTATSTADADAIAKFSFTGVMAGAAHTVTVFNADNSFTGTVNFTAPGDNQAASLAVDGTAQPVLVAGSDTAAPYVYKIAISDGTTSFENGADIGAAASASVVFSFSEAIKADGYATGVVATSNTEMYDHVNAQFVGVKTGNVAHSMAWNAGMTELTVSIPNVSASSIYSVTLDGAANQILDTNDQGLDAANSAGYDGADIVANFTTGGGATVAAPTVVILNDNILDEAGVTNPQLDWTWQAGAASYNVYRTTTVGGATVGSMELETNVTVSSYTPAGVNTIGTYISGELPATYSFVVKAVNSDGTESAGSTAVTANDVIGPADPAGPVCAGTDLTLTFAEDVAEAAAETAANYTVTDGALTISSIAASGTSVVLTLSGNCTTGTVVVKAAVTDIAGNKLNATPASTAGADSAALAY